jgi:hypothetical protein
MEFRLLGQRMAVRTLLKSGDRNAERWEAFKHKIWFCWTSSYKAEGRQRAGEEDPATSQDGRSKR